MPGTEGIFGSRDTEDLITGFPRTEMPPEELSSFDVFELPDIEHRSHVSLPSVVSF
jgi:hypothetical protein